MRKLNNKGITLITLVITIIVLIILASVAAYSGINVIRSSQLTTFTTEMKLAQTKVNELYNKMQTGEKLVIGGKTYKGEDDDNANNTKGFKSLGDLIGSDSQATTAITKAKEFNSSYDYNNIDDYRKYTVDTLKNIGVEGIKQELLINIKKRKVISYNGLEQNGKVYYILEQLPDSMYNVDYSNNNNTEKPVISATSYEELGNWKYRINVAVGYNNGNIEKWNVKYKLTTEEKWSTSYDLSFIVERAGVYDIKVENNGIKSDVSQLRVTNKADTEYRDAYGNLVIVPGGFFVSNMSGESSVDTGVVVIDKNENEWVWIEVPKIGKNAVDYASEGATDNTKTTEIEKALKTYTNTYRNDTSYTDTWYSEAQAGIASSDKYNELKNKMLASIYDNGGFYIGRYEVGTDTARENESDALTPALIQKDKYPYNFVTCKQAQSLATGLISGSKTSSLMFGVQWDLVLRYLENKGATQEELNSDSGMWGNYSNVTFDVENIKASWYNPWTKITKKYTKPINTNKLLTTGATERNSKKNIYDLAGNVWEWNLEYTSGSSSPCASRGGSYNSNSNNSPVSNRYSYLTTSSYSYFGFRSTLF